MKGQPVLMNRVRTTIIALAAIASAAALTGCGVNDADVVSKNISTAADNFEIARRIVFMNNRNVGKYELEIVGRCNVVTEPAQLEVTCKAAGGEYKKHFLGLNGETTYIVEQIESVNVSEDNYRVSFKPEVIIPDVDKR